MGLRKADWSRAKRYSNASFVSGGFVIPDGAVAGVRAHLQHLNGRFTIADIRNALGEAYEPGAEPFVWAFAAVKLLRSRA